MAGQLNFHEMPASKSVKPLYGSHSLFERLLSFESTEVLSPCIHSFHYVFVSEIDYLPCYKI